MQWLDVYIMRECVLSHYSCVQFFAILKTSLKALQKEM